MGTAVDPDVIDEWTPRWVREVAAELRSYVA